MLGCSSTCVRVTGVGGSPGGRLARLTRNVGIVNIAGDVHVTFGLLWVMFSTHPIFRQRGKPRLNRPVAITCDPAVSRVGHGECLDVTRSSGAIATPGGVSLASGARLGVKGVR